MRKRIVAERIDNIGATRVCGPLDFEVYGLESSLPWSRWLESVEGDSPSGVWLGHASSNSDSGAVVGTFSRVHFDQQNHPLGLDPVRAVALAAADRFLNIVGVVPPEARTSEFGDALRAHIAENVHNHQSWPQVSWVVGGVEIVASVWQFAGGWIGTVESVPDTHIAVVGVEVEPYGLQLDQVDGTQYGVDFSNNLAISDLRRRSSTPSVPLPNQHRLHSDLLILDSAR